MTSVPPPTEQFTGVYYNPSFWISSNTTLSQSVANTLYLRKTTTDSASALETFNGGIASQNIAATSLTTQANLFTTQTSGTVQLGNTSVSVHCSNIDCNGNTINNATSPANGNISICNNQTSGNLSLGTNASRTGLISIGGNNNIINYAGYLTPTYTAYPSASGGLGYRFKLTNAFASGQAMTTATDYTVVNQVLPLGVWLVQGSILLTSTATTNIANSIITTSYNTIVQNVVSEGSGVIGITTYYPQSSSVILSDGASSLTIVYRASFTVSTLSISAGQTNMYWYATRIA